MEEKKTGGYHGWVGRVSPLRADERTLTSEKAEIYWQSFNGMEGKKTARRFYAAGWL